MATTLQWRKASWSPGKLGSSRVCRGQGHKLKTRKTLVIVGTKKGQVQFYRSFAFIVDLFLGAGQPLDFFTRKQYYEYSIARQIPNILNRESCISKGGGTVRVAVSLIQFSYFNVVD